MNRLFFHDVLLETTINKSTVNLETYDDQKINAVIIDVIYDYLLTFTKPLNKKTKRFEKSSGIISFVLCGIITAIIISVSNSYSHITIRIELLGGNKKDYKFCKNLFDNLTNFIKNLSSNQLFNDAINLANINKNNNEDNFGQIILK